MEPFSLNENSSIEEVEHLIRELVENSQSQEKVLAELNRLLHQAFSLKTQSGIREYVILEIEKYRSGLEMGTLEEYLKGEAYQKMTFSQRVAFWSGSLHSQMRSQVEAGLDEYQIYSPEWHSLVLKIDPDFDKIMEEVFSQKWNNVWSKKEYEKRIRPE